jgi:endoglucanase
LAKLPIDGSSHNLIKKSTFVDGKSLPWTTSFSAPGAGAATVDGGVYCLHVTNKGHNNWDAQIRHREMTIQKGHKYAVRFKIASSVPTSVLAKVGMSGPPYKTYWQNQTELRREGVVVTSDFTMDEADDPTAELAFHAGGPLAPKAGPYTVCVDSVVLEDPTFTPVVEAPPAPVPQILVNQVGYFPTLAKLAVLKSAEATPVGFELLDATGGVVFSGKTTVHGVDVASGDAVHQIDFSAYTRPGKRYKLRVAKEESHPFDIRWDLYNKLKYDALAYFYHNRSGIAIEMPYAGDSKWTRPAGHVGDKSIPCAPDANCSYSLDVSGGWYDAGDHGKYVVNGGVSVFTLLDQYERAKFLGKSSGDFADGRMNIPENKNGVPDILDEARWELEFELRMQVPEGQPLAGMAHHKIHDKEWTALATAPDKDPVPRFLRPVSTAATLNLAANAAQCARIWKGIDAKFSSRCLAAAERAWAAAMAHPAMLAPASDTIGGGPYEDNDVSDEFYWAAAELFVTTGKDVYKAFVMSSPHYKLVSSASTAGTGQGDAMTWQSTAALGTISLAVVPNALPASEAQALRSAIVKRADAYLAIQASEGYLVPFRPAEVAKGYPWGSNSSIANNAVVLGLAFDLTKDKKYLNGVVEAMDYLLGRNPLDQSFITGYGSRPLSNPHHRFWAHQANPAFPSAPPGVLSGGPNSGLQDPYVKAAGLAGCAPMKCFVDNIEAWSANEITINWNAPLAWVAAFLDEQGQTLAGQGFPSKGTKPKAAKPNP